jgi:hypothetical protein
VCEIAFEAGYSEIDCPKIVINSWDRSYKEKKEGWDIDEDGVVYTSAMELIDELEVNCPYNMVVLDTLDMCAKMASDYHCALAHVDHPSEGGDWGRGWDVLQTRPVRMFYSRLVRLGLGVAAITHSQKKEDEDKFGKKRAKRETSLPGKIQHFAHTQSDVIMHGFFARRRHGQKDRDRYISFDGTDYLMAGARVRKVYLPNKYIVTPPTRTSDSPPWNQWASFFSRNPEAGKEAELEFVRLYKGRQDETVEEDLAETETETDSQTQSKQSYDKEKVSQTNRKKSSFVKASRTS